MREKLMFLLKKIYEDDEDSTVPLKGDWYLEKEENDVDNTINFDSPLDTPKLTGL